MDALSARNVLIAVYVFQAKSKTARLKARPPPRDWDEGHLCPAAGPSPITDHRRLTGATHYSGYAGGQIAVGHVAGQTGSAFRLTQCGSAWSERKIAVFQLPPAACCVRL